VFDAEQSQVDKYMQTQQACQPTLAQCMQAFVGALQCMSGLTRFHWLVTQMQPTSTIFATLPKCSALIDVDIFPREVLHSDIVTNSDEYGVCTLS